MIDRLLDKGPNKKAPPKDTNQKAETKLVGDEDPIMNSLQTRLKLEGIDLGIKGVGMVNIDGVDKSALMKPHNPSNMNHGFIKDDFEIDNEPSIDGFIKPSEPNKSQDIVPILSTNSEIREIPNEE